MKSSTILTITTALGNVAVLAGLVFLIIEMRHSHVDGALATRSRFK